MNEVVTNNLLRWVAAQVYLEDIDFTSQPRRNIAALQ